MSPVIEINDNNFDSEVLNSDIPVLVDFWATWCGPCRKFAPVIEELSDLYAEKIKFVKIKADENNLSAQKYSVIGVPCILLFKNAAPVERIVNAVPKSVIENILNKYASAGENNDK